MDILIKDMQMPTGDEMLCINIFPDGKVTSHFDLRCMPVAKAVPVQPHGHLIDTDALWAEINKICDRRDAGIITDLTCLQQILSAVRHAPTIIEASNKSVDTTVKEKT